MVDGRLFRIVHLSHSDSYGGAAIAARRLCQAMTKAGLESSLVTAKDLSPIRPTASCLERLLEKIHSKFYWKHYNKELKEYHVTGSWSLGASLNRLDSNPLVQQADVVYLHWVNHSMLSIEEIGKLLDSGKPVIWFLHDMWPMTGGCHYAFDCLRYQQHCRACPMLDSIVEQDAAAHVFRRKIKYFLNHPNLGIVSPSRWLAECAKNSRLFHDKRIEVIPNVINFSIFHPIRKEIAREALGLPVHRKIILFGCDGGIKNFYKGWIYLEQALQKLDMKDTMLVIFGQDGDSAITRQSNMAVRFLGYLHDEFPSLVLAYSAADVFVSPSIAENFSQTLCESSACGTPTVCFDVGGNSDIVLHKMTGYLAKYKDSDDFANGINWILKDVDNIDLGKNAQEHIKGLCSQKIIVDKHRKLIELLM